MRPIDPFGSLLYDPKGSTDRLGFRSRHRRRADHIEGHSQPQEDARMTLITQAPHPRNRGSYIGGSDARIVLGKDENALIQLWKEKRGEIEPEDLSGNLLVQFGCATEDLTLV
jgi:hypothetical protein